MQASFSFTLALALTIAAGRVARADEVPITGFTTKGTGALSGRVTDEEGHPIGGVVVHVASPSGSRQQVTTDAAGRYRVTIRSGDAYSMVYVRRRARIGGQLSIPRPTASGEVIEMYDTIPPTVMPALRGDPRAIPPYSERAKDKDAWTRAWLMLDIDEHGAVTRVKLMQRPGLDLDEIAIREAFALRFEPARDLADRPVSTLALWTFEWPAYWWLIERGNRSTHRLPEGIEQMPCRGDGGVRRYHRDCTPVDLERGMAERWIAKPGL